MPRPSTQFLIVGAGAAGLMAARELARVGKKVTMKRRITGLSATSPNHTGRSIEINSQAIPILKSEALSAQSANIDLVSGATDSSSAFVQSLQAAILKAKKA